MHSDRNEHDRTQSYIALSEGAQVGRYVIRERIGSGGMGDVYLAEDSDLGRKVALKFLPRPLLNDEKAITRFRREAQAAAGLNHPNIVTIYEVADYQGFPFIAMEYIEGEALDVILERSPLTVEETMAIIIQLARGLLAAHEQGIIHRDIKPGNICICFDGRVKILDFGLALVKGQEGLTEPNMVVGTMGYNSPEQVSNDPVDKRTDIWSLGVLMYRMLTQKMPFTGDSAPAILYSIKHNPPSDIMKVREDIPDSLQTLYRKCLEKDPTKRPQSMFEILHLLGAEATSGTTPLRFGRSRRRKMLFPAIIGVICLVVLAWAVRSYIPPKHSTQKERIWRIGVLPFHDQTPQDKTSAWPSLIQVMFVSNLTGVSNIGAVDPLSLNALIRDKLNTDDPVRNPHLYHVIRDADIAYIIDGTIIRTGAEYKIMTNVVELDNGEILESCDAVVPNEDSLPVAVKTMSKQVLEFFQARILAGDYDEDLQPWLSRRPQNLDALKAFMQASEFLFNSVPGAERYLQRAIDLDSTFVAPRIWMISIFVQQHKIDSAMIHYNKLLELEPQANPFEQAMISWAGAYIKDDPRARANALQLALIYSPGNNILLYELARARYALGEYRAAVDALRPAAAARWRHSPAYYLLGASYCSLGDYAQARRVLEQSLKITPVYPHIYGLLSGVTYELGDKDAAARYERLYLQEEENHGLNEATIYTMLAQNSANMGFTDNAIRCYRKALARRPNDPALHAYLGELMFQIQDWEETRTEFTRVMEIDSTRAESYLMLGAACDSLGDHQSAIRNYIAYLKHDSTSAKATEVRNRLQNLSN